MGRYSKKRSSSRYRQTAIKQLADSVAKTEANEEKIEEVKEELEKMQAKTGIKMKNLIPFVAAAVLGSVIFRGYGRETKYIRPVPLALGNGQLALGDARELQDDPFKYAYKEPHYAVQRRRLSQYRGAYRPPSTARLSARASRSSQRRRRNRSRRRSGRRM